MKNGNKVKAYKLYRKAVKKLWLKLKPFLYNYGYNRTKFLKEELKLLRSQCFIDLKFFEL